MKKPVCRYDESEFLGSASESASAAEEILDSEARSRGRRVRRFGSTSFSGESMWSFTFCAVLERWVANTGRLVVFRKCLVSANESPRVAGVTRMNGLVDIVGSL